MSFSVGKKSVGFGGKGSREGPQKGPEAVSGSGEDGSREMKRMLRPIKFGTLVVFVAIAALGSFYTLSENEITVLTIFGRPSSVMTSRPKFKYPFIQKAYKMPKETKGMPIGYDPDYNTEYPANSENNSVPLPSEPEIVTKDFNFVSVDFYTEYQTMDPIRAYINSDTAISILKSLTQPYIRDTVGSYSVDEVIITSRSEIQARAKSLLSERLEQEDIGTGIVNVTIQGAEPPTKAVNNTSKTVEDAKQSMDIKINKTERYQSEQLPAANVKADEAVRDAEAYRQQRISEAEGQVSHFNDMYEGYTKYPLITRKRILYETTEELLPTLKVVINGSNETQAMLPLDSFISEDQNGGVQ